MPPCVGPLGSFGYSGGPLGGRIDSKRLFSFTRVIIASETRQALRMDPTSWHPPYLSYIRGAFMVFTDTSVIQSSLPGIRRGCAVNHWEGDICVSSIPPRGEKKDSVESIASKRGLSDLRYSHRVYHYSITPLVVYLAVH